MWTNRLYLWLLTRAIWILNINCRIDQIFLHDIVQVWLFRETIQCLHVPGNGFLAHWRNGLRVPRVNIKVSLSHQGFTFTSRVSLSHQGLHFHNSGVQGQHQGFNFHFFVARCHRTLELKQWSIFAFIFSGIRLFEWVPCLLRYISRLLNFV